MTAQEIEQLAETQWEQIGGWNDDFKKVFIAGFEQGYLSGRIEGIDNQIEKNRNRIADLLTNGLDCHYSGLPSPKSYDI
jgi:hypothetical protein